MAHSVTCGGEEEALSRLGARAPVRPRRVASMRRCERARYYYYYYYYHRQCTHGVHIVRQVRRGGVAPDAACIIETRAFPAVRSRSMHVSRIVATLPATHRKIARIAARDDYLSAKNCRKYCFFFLNKHIISLLKSIYLLSMRKEKKEEKKKKFQTYNNEMFSKKIESRLKSKLWTLIGN